MSDAEKFTGVHPTLVARLQQVYVAMTALGMPMRPTDGTRTAGQQVILYAKGRTAKGPDVTPDHPMGRIVTNADGLRKKSNHQPHPDGYGHAVDSCFLGADPYLEKHPRGAVWWACFGACCEAVNLKWGGSAAFKAAGIVDQPHAELGPV